MCKLWPLVILLCLFFLVPIPRRLSASVKLKNKYIYIGGGGNISLQAFADAAGNANGLVAIVPSASIFVEEGAIYYQQCFTQYGLKSIIVHTTDRKIANSIDFCNQLNMATAIWFTGGDQLRLLKIYGGTRFARTLKQKCNNGVVIGGTSAGASALSNVMMYEGNGEAGFGLLDNIIIDQHFLARSRLARLQALLEKYPTCVGIGIDENSVLLYNNGQFYNSGPSPVEVIRNKHIISYVKGTIFKP